MYCHWNGKLNIIEKYKEKYKNHTNSFYLEIGIINSFSQNEETISEISLEAT